MRIWRVWMTGRATLREIETHWSIDDLYDALDVLDYEIEYNQSEVEDQRRKK